MHLLIFPSPYPPSTLGAHIHSKGGKKEREKRKYREKIKKKKKDQPDPPSPCCYIIYRR